eukprot:gene7849-5477_t
MSTTTSATHNDVPLAFHDLSSEAILNMPPSEALLKHLENAQLAHRVCVARALKPTLYPELTPNNGDDAPNPVDLCALTWGEVMQRYRQWAEYRPPFESKEAKSLWSKYWTKKRQAQADAAAQSHAGRMGDRTGRQEGSAYTNTYALRCLHLFKRCPSSNSAKRLQLPFRPSPSCKKKMSELSFQPFFKQMPPFSRCVFLVSLRTVHHSHSHRRTIHSLSGTNQESLIAIACHSREVAEAFHSQIQINTISDSVKPSFSVVIRLADYFIIIIIIIILKLLRDQPEQPQRRNASSLFEEEVPQRLTLRMNGRAAPQEHRGVSSQQPGLVSASPTPSAGRLINSLPDASSGGERQQASVGSTALADRRPPPLLQVPSGSDGGRYRVSGTSLPSPRGPCGRATLSTTGEGGAGAAGHGGGAPAPPTQASEWHSPPNAQDSRDTVPPPLPSKSSTGLWGSPGPLTGTTTTPQFSSSMSNGGGGLYTGSTPSYRNGDGLTNTDELLVGSATNDTPATTPAAVPSSSSGRRAGPRPSHFAPQHLSATTPANSVAGVMDYNHTQVRVLRADTTAVSPLTRAGGSRHFMELGRPLECTPSGEPQTQSDAAPAGPPGRGLLRPGGRQRDVSFMGETLLRDAPRGYPSYPAAAHHEPMSSVSWGGVGREPPSGELQSSEQHNVSSSEVDVGRRHRRESGPEAGDGTQQGSGDEPDEADEDEARHRGGRRCSSGASHSSHTSHREKKAGRSASFVTSLFMEVGFVYMLGFLCGLCTLILCVVHITSIRKVYLNFLDADALAEEISKVVDPSFIVITVCCACLFVYVLVGVFLAFCTRRDVQRAAKKLEEFVHFFEMVSTWDLEHAPVYVRDTTLFSQIFPETKETYTLLLYSVKGNMERSTEVEMSLANVRLRTYKNRILALHEHRGGNRRGQAVLLQQAVQQQQQQQDEVGAVPPGVPAPPPAPAAVEEESHLQQFQINPQFQRFSGSNVGTPSNMPRRASFTSSSPPETNNVVRGSSSRLLPNHLTPGPPPPLAPLLRSRDSGAPPIPPPPPGSGVGLQASTGGIAGDDDNVNHLLLSVANVTSHSTQQSSVMGTNGSSPGPSFAAVSPRYSSCANRGHRQSIIASTQPPASPPQASPRSARGVRGSGSSSHSVAAYPLSPRSSAVAAATTSSSSAARFTAGAAPVYFIDTFGAPMLAATVTNLLSAPQSGGAHRESISSLNNSSCQSDDTMSLVTAPGGAPLPLGGATPSQSAVPPLLDPGTAVTVEGFVVPDKNAILKAYRKQQPLATRNCSVIIASFSGFYDAMWFDQRYTRSLSNLFLSTMTDIGHYYGGLTIVNRPDRIMIIWNTKALPRPKDHREIALACGRALGVAMRQLVTTREGEKGPLDGFYPVLLGFTGKFLVGTIGDTQLQLRLVVRGRRLQVAHSVLTLLHFLRQVRGGPSGAWITDDEKREAGRATLTLVWMGTEPPPTEAYFPFDLIQGDEPHEKYVLYGVWGTDALPEYMLKSMDCFRRAFYAFTTGEHEEAFQLFMKSQLSYPGNPLLVRLKHLAQYFALEQGPPYARRTPHWTTYGAETSTEEMEASLKIREENARVAAKAAAMTAGCNQLDAAPLEHGRRIAVLAGWRDRVLGLPEDRLDGEGCGTGGSSSSPLTGIEEMTLDGGAVFHQNSKSFGSPWKAGVSAMSTAAPPGLPLVLSPSMGPTPVGSPAHRLLRQAVGAPKALHQRGAAPPQGTVVSTCRSGPHSLCSGAEGPSSPIHRKHSSSSSLTLPDAAIAEARPSGESEHSSLFRSLSTFSADPLTPPVSPSHTAAGSRATGREEPRATVVPAPAPPATRASSSSGSSRITPPLVGLAIDRPSGIPRRDGLETPFSNSLSSLINNEHREPPPRSSHSKCSSRSSFLGRGPFPHPTSPSRRSRPIAEDSVLAFPAGGPETDVALPPPPPPPPPTRPDTLSSSPRDSAALTNRSSSGSGLLGGMGSASATANTSNGIHGSAAEASHTTSALMSATSSVQTNYSSDPLGQQPLFPAPVSSAVVASPGASGSGPGPAPGSILVTSPNSSVGANASGSGAGRRSTTATPNAPAPPTKRATVFLFANDEAPERGGAVQHSSGGSAARRLSMFGPNPLTLPPSMPVMPAGPAAPVTGIGSGGPTAAGGDGRETTPAPYAAAESSSSSGGGGRLAALSTDITDRQGMKFRLSQRVLGRGASGEVRLGLSHSGALVAVKVVELMVAKGAPRPEVGGGPTPTANDAPPAAASQEEGGGAATARAKAIQRRRLRRKGIQLEDNATQTINSLTAEIEMLSRLRHSCIVGYIGAVGETARLMLIMEYTSGGSLQKVLDLFTDMTGEQAVGYLKDVLSRRLPWGPHATPISVSCQLCRDETYKPEPQGAPLAPEAMEVFLACTQRDPDKRPSAHTILQMPLFRNAVGGGSCYQNTGAKRHSSHTATTTTATATTAPGVPTSARSNYPVGAAGSTNHHVQGAGTNNNSTAAITTPLPPASASLSPEQRAATAQTSSLAPPTETPASNTTPSPPVAKLPMNTPTTTTSPPEAHLHHPYHPHPANNEQQTEVDCCAASTVRVVRGGKKQQEQQTEEHLHIPSHRRAAERRTRELKEALPPDSSVSLCLHGRVDTRAKVKRLRTSARPGSPLDLSVERERERDGSKYRRKYDYYYYY